MLKKQNSYTRLIKNKNYFWQSLIIIIIINILYFYSGFIFGFSKSPFNHDIFSIIKNLSKELLPIIGIEATRIYLLKEERTSLNYIFITIILLILQLDFEVLMTLSRESLFKYIGSSIIPIITKNIFYTYIDLNENQGFPLILETLNKLIIFLLPILPSLDWFLKCCFSLIFTMFMYLFFKSHPAKTKKITLQKPKMYFKKINYPLTLLFIIVYISFILGKFSYKPIAILSNSMQPIFNRGDVVIFQKIKDDDLANLKKNTIIIYQINNQYIAHRIIRVIHENKQTFYLTKGDNNKSSDYLKVSKKQILGTYVLTIRYVGYPSVWLNDYFHKKIEK